MVKAVAFFTFLTPALGCKHRSQPGPDLQHALGQGRRWKIDFIFYDRLAATALCCACTARATA
jgi:hypothetical protein